MSRCESIIHFKLGRLHFFTLFLVKLCKPPVHLFRQTLSPLFISCLSVSLSKHFTTGVRKVYNVFAVLHFRVFSFSLNLKDITLQCFVECEVFHQFTSDQSTLKVLVDMSMLCLRCNSEQVRCKQCLLCLYEGICIVATWVVYVTKIACTSCDCLSDGVFNVTASQRNPSHRESQRHNNSNILYHWYLSFVTRLPAVLTGHFRLLHQNVPVSSFVCCF